MITAAIVGLGRWGQRMVESVQGKSKHIRFAAAVTRTTAKAEAFAKTHGLTLGSDLDAALKDPKIDALVIVTPNSQHAPQMMAGAKAGKHLLVDKPFTLTKKSAAEAVEAATKRGLIIAAAHNRRFLPTYREMRKRLTAGQIGIPNHIETNFSGASGFTYTAEMWRAERAESPAGGMTAMGIHTVDSIIGLCGRIERVHALSRRRVLDIDIDDTTSMLFEFASGMTGSLATMASASNWRLQAFGGDGWLEIRDSTHFEYQPRTGKREIIDFPPTDIESAELEAFALAIKKEAPYPIPPEDVIHGIAVLEAIDRSARSGQTTKVE
ncbi:MAG: Gfo/Idh/MocA family oxidoreductase [Rhodospirillales bacterium]|nr:Gfo/Idh/MocA family oxidoreductase [Rhodospirillales bacterium]